MAKNSVAHLLNTISVTIEIPDGAGGTTPVRVTAKGTPDSLRVKDTRKLLRTAKKLKVKGVDKNKKASDQVNSEVSGKDIAVWIPADDDEKTWKEVYAEMADTAYEEAMEYVQKKIEEREMTEEQAKEHLANEHERYEEIQTKWEEKFEEE